MQQFGKGLCLASEDVEINPIMRQVIVTTLFGPGIENVARTFSTLAKIPGAELHAFILGRDLPVNRHPLIHYHLVQPDSRFVSVRRDALFRRWVFPDQLDADYAMVADGTDVICVNPPPPFQALLRGAALAGSPEWGGPVKIPGQGYTSTYLNAGVTFWHLPSSREMRNEIVARGRARYRGPFDDQTALNEVALTRYFDRLTILPSQYNWRAMYRKSAKRTWRTGWRKWPRLDSLEGVSIYHNTHCVNEVLSALALSEPHSKAELPPLLEDEHPLSLRTLILRRLLHRWLHTG